VLLGLDARDVRRRRDPSRLDAGLAVIMFVEKAVIWGRVMTTAVEVVVTA
jgi:hypothetical protein